LGPWGAAAGKVVFSTCFYLRFQNVRAAQKFRREVEGLRRLFLDSGLRVGSAIGRQTVRNC
jgi:hypothetical protein